MTTYIATLISGWEGYSIRNISSLINKKCYDRWVLFILIGFTEYDACTPGAEWIVNIEIHLKLISMAESIDTVVIYPFNQRHVNERCRIVFECLADLILLL
jgi:hypothetical protein